MNEILHDPLFLLHTTRYTHGFLLAGILYLLIRFDVDGAFEHICFTWLFPALWYVAIGYGVFEVLQNFTAHGRLYFDLFFTNPGKAGVFMLLAGMINYKHIRQSARSSKRIGTGLTWLSILAALVLLLISGSRSAWMGGLTAITVYVVFATKFINRKWLSILLFVALGVVVLTIAAFYKADSGWGRILIWKVSLQNFEQYLFNGIGIDKFGAVYNSWQSDYFSHVLPVLSKEAYLADNTFFAFNEYIQFAVELGAIPVLFLTSWFIFTLVTVKKQMKPAYKLFLLATGISACTFYTFHLPVVQLLIAIVIGFVSNTARETTKRYPVMAWHKVLLAVPVCCLFKILIDTGSLLKAVPHWLQARANIEYNETDAYDAYTTAATYLQAEGQFMIEYAYFLATLKKFDESIEATRRSQMHRTYQSSLLNYGNCYEQRGNTALAEYWYKKAIACVPFRLGPRYKLILLYDRLHQKDKVQMAAQQALALALKNPNDALSLELRHAIKRISAVDSTHYNNQ